MPNPIADLQQKLQWTTRGENCPLCDALRGRVYTYDTWMSSGVWPGFHYNCDCYLKKVGADSVISDLDFFGTSLNLLHETINPDFMFLRLHWDPNYQPFSWYMTTQITQAHLSYGSGLPIGQVLKKMKDQFLGFFKRSKIFDNFFIWRVFRTVQHFQDQDGGFTGGLPPLYSKKSRFTIAPPAPFKRYPSFSRTKSKSYSLPGYGFKRYPSLSMSHATLKPKSLKPLWPYQSNYTERGR